MKAVRKFGAVLSLVSVIGCSKDDVRPIPVTELSSIYDRMEAYITNRFAVVLNPSDPHYLHLGKVIYIDIHDGGTESTKYADGTTGYCTRSPHCISYDLPPNGYGDCSKLRADCAATTGCNLDSLKSDYTSLTGRPAPF